MSYVVHFLRIDAGQDWVDALEAQERRASRARRGTDAALSRQCWRIANRALHALRKGEVRRGVRFLRILEPSSGLQLDIFNEETSLSVPFVHEQDEARDVLERARDLARIVEAETGLIAFDAQLGRPFLASDDGLELGASVMASTRLELARFEANDAPAFRFAPRSQTS